MWPQTMPRPLRQGVAAIAVAGMLTGCAQGGLTTRGQRIGSDDGTDACRRELVALDSTGDFFGEDIVKGAIIGTLGGALIGGLTGGSRGALIGAGAGLAAGAAGGYLSARQQQSRDQAGLLTQVQSDLQQEGIQIDRSQLAFDQLTDCRFRQAQAIRDGYRSGVVTRPAAQAQMDGVRQLARRDIQLAQLINKGIQARAVQFDDAAEQLSPGSRAAISSYAQPRQRTVTVRRPVSVKVRPNGSSPEVTQIKAQERIKITSTRGDYAVVETSSGARGYAPLSSLQQPAGPTPSAGGGDIRTLAGSNAARRDGFAQSVAVSESAAATSFELAG